MQETSYEYDIIVVGAGHAGTEAAMAAARMGAKCVLLTTNLDTVGQMSCNPAIGGVGKGQIVREIDALGGIMGQAIDRSGLQFRLLNRRKGPAMHSPRAQADKKRYQLLVKQMVEEQESLDLKQEIVEDILTESIGEQHRVIGVSVRGNAIYRAPCIVLTTGTFLKALMHTGESKTPGGRAGEGTTTGISGALHRLGFEVERFKTGTPPRVNGRTIDFAACEEQPGDDEPQPFSFTTTKLEVDQLPCWITYTNKEVHQLINDNLDRAPMYSGQISGSGPRYCPSIEDKVVRFADRDEHQLFLEPEGYDTQEFYVNGISTSLPRDVQDSMFRMIKGLENAQVMRYGYAVEYDFCPPDQLQVSLESKAVDGLFLAGQINGTTGYEEAGAQGLVAGTNAALKHTGNDPLVLDREQAYIGVLIDDLVTKGVDEPYRMFTSRAEHRLRLRQDNADRRLTPLAAKLGLVDTERAELFESKRQRIDDTAKKIESTRHGQYKLSEWLRRPEITWSSLIEMDSSLTDVDPMVAEQVCYDVKYAGYIARQEVQIKRQQRLADRVIPSTFNYAELPHLRIEAKEKLGRVKPTNLAQASRISGITPADLALLTAHLESRSTK